MNNIIEKLQEIQTKEVKRRKEAVKCIEELTEILAPILVDIEGDIVNTEQDYYYGTEAIWIHTWNKEKNKYDFSNSNLYFRYDKHYCDTKTEKEGFYYTEDSLSKLWGVDILDIKGTNFWIAIKEITDWIVNYLPKYIENKDRSRDQRLEKLIKITELLKHN